MNNFTIVRTEHLNHHKKLFGGQMLKWVDEFAWITASRDFFGANLVTRAMSEIEFNEPVPNGSILRFQITPKDKKTTSVSYSVKVFADEPGARLERMVFETSVIFVNLDENGKKSPLPEITTYRSMQIK